MAQASNPTRQQIRDCRERHKSAGKPLPDMKEIRRQLGWELIEMRRNGTTRR